MLAKEKQQHSLLLNNLSTRHSRFGGLLQKKTDMGNKLLSIQSVVNRSGIVVCFYYLYSYFRIKNLLHL